MNGDGCMMEGISSEAASLAGHLQLNNLVWIYDNNHISIEGNTEITFTEDVGARFTAYGWNVLRVHDANDLALIESTLKEAITTETRPTMIIVDSHIGYGSPHRQGHTGSARRTTRPRRSKAHQKSLQKKPTAGRKMRSSWCRTASINISRTAWASAAKSARGVEQTF